MSGESVLELDRVTKVYGEEPPEPALRRVSFSVRRGELVGLMPARVMAAAAGEVLLLPGLAADRALEVAAHGEFGEG